MLADLRELAAVRGAAQECPRRAAARASRTGSSTLGYAGRRVLTSRKWSGKTLADHCGDRKAQLLETLGLDHEPDPARYTWHVVTSSDPDHLPYERRLLHIVAERTRLKSALDEVRRKAEEPDGNLSAERKAA